MDNELKNLIKEYVNDFITKRKDKNLKNYIVPNSIPII